MYASYIRLILVSVVMSCTTGLSAQSTTTIFPGLSGQELIDSLISRYKPTATLPYNIARDTLYARVFAKNDSLRCIYTGHTLYLDPLADPTTYVFLNGASNGINAEHGYPQSKGASEGFGRSDMHHLFPTRVAVNSARSTLPYGESPDETTKSWYVGTYQEFSIPAINKDLYSEVGQTVFEPREDAKGDVARAVFYFYTMYKAAAQAADPNFFEIQRPTLCKWNVQDPVSIDELNRTFRIAPYQEGKPNPFIVDCTTAFRCYCPQDPAVCQKLTDTAAPEGGFPLNLYPNPFIATAQLELELPFEAEVYIRALSILGQELLRFEPGRFASGPLQLGLNMDNGPLQGRSWMGMLEVELRGRQGSLKRTLRIFKSK